MNEIKQIGVNKLLLDLENPRFPSEISGQRAAINLMLDIQEDKIVRLAKDIAANGIDPSENLIVYESSEEPGLFVVAEGNRRTTALKLIIQPTLADSEKIRKTFSKIKESSTQVISKVSCVVFDDESYEHWVNIKHTGDNKGVGRERWTTPEADRYRAKHGKQSYQSQLYTFMLRQETAFADILKKKKFVYATNLSRLFGDRKTRARFGLTALDGYLYCSISFNDFIAKFKKVLDVMTDIPVNKNKPEFNVKNIYTPLDREVFLNDLEIEESPKLLETAWKLDDPYAEKSSLKVEKPKGSDNDDKSPSNVITQPEVTEPKGADPEGQNTTATGPKSVSKPIPKTNRNVLIPSTLKLDFGGNSKCAKIFSELKSKMTHEDTPFSIAVMLRVFIDLSLSSFMEKKDIKYIDHKNPNRTPGLHDKVVLCGAYLKNEKLLTQAQYSSICAFSKDKLNASGTIQQYVHNQHLIPSKDIVNIEWDNFQPLIEGIWSTAMQEL